MSVSKEINFHGKLDVADGDPPEYVATIRYSRWNPTVLDVDILWIGGDQIRRRGANTFSRLGKNHIWLHSLDPVQPDVELLGIDGASSSYSGTSVRSSSVRVAAVQVGITQELHSHPRQLSVIIQLQPSGILSLPTIHEHHYDGHTSVESVEEGLIPLQIGKAQLEAGLTYEYDSSKTDGDEITNRVQRATFMGRLDIEPSESLFDVHEQLKEALSDACIALSLCYRQTVDYYQIEYMDNDAQGKWMLHRRRWNSVKSRASGDELIHARALRDGGLQRLVNGIRGFPRAEELRQAIKFLAASYTAELETAFFMTFSAMEAVVACCLEEGEEFALAGAKWEKFKSDINKKIKELIPHSNNREIRAKVYEKIPELQRIALVRRVIIACERQKPKTDDLWVGISFKEGIEKAARARNGLFHVAGTGIDVMIGLDLIRVRTFTERLLLKLLSWPDEDVWVWYDQNLKWANQQRC